MTNNYDHDRPARTHECPGGCGAQVPSRLVACKEDWFRLPQPLRRAVNSAYRQGPGAHRAALAAALRWYRDNPREEVATGG